MKVVPFRRKREQKTDYKKRLNLLKSKTPRLVIRLTKNNVTAQIIKFKPAGDEVVCTITGKQLEKLGYNLNKGNTCAAYLAGLAIGKAALAKKITTAIPDFGLHGVVKKTRLFAVIKGAIEAGLKINCPKEVLPSDERVSGKHVEDYAKLKEDAFSNYIKKGIKVNEITKTIQTVKNKIIG